VAATRAKKAPETAVKVEGRLVVTQVKSGIGTKPKHRGTLRALGSAASASRTISLTGRRFAG